MSGNSELTLRIIMHIQEQSAGDEASTLALKPMGRSNQSPKQIVPVAPQNGDLSPQKKTLRKRIIWHYISAYFLSTHWKKHDESIWQWVFRRQSLTPGFFVKCPHWWKCGKSLLSNRDLMVVVSAIYFPLYWIKQKEAGSQKYPKNLMLGTYIFWSHRIKTTRYTFWNNKIKAKYWSLILIKFILNIWFNKCLAKVCILSGRLPEPYCAAEKTSRHPRAPTVCRHVFPA